VGGDNRVVLIEKGILFIFYDDGNVKALDAASGSLMNIEGVRATEISSVLYKKYSELKGAELKLIEELPYFTIGEAGRAEDGVLIGIVREIEEEIADIYGLELHKTNRGFYKVFSLRKHLWVNYQQGYLLPISLQKGYSMLEGLCKNEILCIGDDDLMCAYLLLENSEVRRAYVADIDGALLRFYKNVVNPIVPNKEIITVEKDFAKTDRIDPLDGNRKAISFTNPPTRINMLRKFLQLAAKHSEYTLLPSSFPHLLKSVVPSATVYRLSPLSAFSLRFTVTHKDLVIDTTHIGPAWAVVKWQG